MYFSNIFDVSFEMIRGADLVGTVYHCVRDAPYKLSPQQMSISARVKCYHLRRFRLTNTMMSLRAVETHTDVHRTVENFGNDCEGDVGDTLHSLDGRAAATRRHLDQPRDRDDPLETQTFPNH